MKDIQWNQSKNEQLKSERDVSFEDVLVAITQGNILDDSVHPNQEKYPNQRLLVVKIKEYAYLVPSRKATKQYLTRSESHE